MASLNRSLPTFAGETMARLFFSVGDASGDLYAAAVARCLKKLRPNWQLEGIGGVHMYQANIRLFALTPAFSAFGVWSAFRRGFSLWTLFQRLFRQLHANPPDLFVPVDFGAFNRRLLLPMAQKGVRVFYFVPPSFWGVPPERLRRYAHPNIVFAPIYPWQRDKLLQAGAQVREFGHPLVDILRPIRQLSPLQARQRLPLPLDRRLVGLFPGSRLTTVQENLPILLQVTRRLHERDKALHFAIGLPPDWHLDRIRRHLTHDGSDLPLSVHIGNSHLLLRACDVALLVAGTITLEAACLEVPAVALFWTGLLNRLQVHWLWWQGVKVTHLGPFALPNRLLGDIVMPEFIGWSVDVPRITETVWQLLTDESKAEGMRQRFRQVWERLGDPGACERVAKFLADWR